MFRNARVCHGAQEKAQAAITRAGGCAASDKEADGGVLASHHAFWSHPENTRLDCSITELIFVPDEVKDGSYLLNLSFAPLDNDASPSRPTLYKIF